MRQRITTRSIHLMAAAALLLGGLPLVAQQQPTAPTPPAPTTTPEPGGPADGGPGGGGPMGPHRPPMERAFRMGPFGRWWDNPDMVQKLGLSTDQQKKMDDIFQQSRLKLIDQHAAVEKEEAILEPLISADQPNEGQVLAQIDKVAQARAELEKANARMLLGLRRVLTPQQWATLRTVAPEMRGRRGGPGGPGARFGRFGADRPPTPPAGGPGE